jgi:hypothetical protein
MALPSMCWHAMPVFGSGSRLGSKLLAPDPTKKVMIRPDPDPQHFNKSTDAISVCRAAETGLQVAAKSRTNI